MNLYTDSILSILHSKNQRILKKKKKSIIQITWPMTQNNVPRNRVERTTGITSCQAIRPGNHVATKITMYERADRDMQMKTVTGRTNHTGISRDPNR